MAELTITIPFISVTIPVSSSLKPTAKILDVQSLTNFTITDPAAGKNQGATGLLVILAVDFGRNKDYSLYGCKISIGLVGDEELTPTIYVDKVNFKRNDSAGNKIRMTFDFPAEFNPVEKHRIAADTGNIRIIPCLLPGHDCKMHPVKMDDLKEVKIMLNDGKRTRQVDVQSGMRKKGYTFLVFAFGFGRQIIHDGRLAL